MTRPSSIDRLPAEVREEIGRLRRQGRTIDEILAKLRELLDATEAPSRSSLGRHIQQLDAIAASIQHSRAVAEAIVDRFGDAPENKVARVNIEMMHGVMMKLMIGEDGTQASLDPQEAMFVATSLQKLASASKLDVEREVKIRDEVRREAAKKLDTAVQDAERAGEPGLSADRIAQLRRDFLGVRG